MRAANDNLPVLTDMVSEESSEMTGRMPRIVTTAFELPEEDAAGYDPYNSAPAVVDLRGRS